MSEFVRLGICEDTQPSNKKKYFDRLNDCACDLSSSSSSLCPPPTAPSAISVTNITKTSFVVNWSRVLGASGYILDISRNASFTIPVIGYDGLLVTDLTKLVNNLIPGTVYYIRVRSTSWAGISVNFASIIQITVPNAPNQPIITNVTPTQFLITWNQVFGASSYLVDVSTNSNFSSGMIFNETLVNGTSFLATNLPPSTLFYVRVKAFNNTTANPVKSEPSSIVSQITSTSINFTNITTTSFVVNWSAFSGAINYNLDVATDGNFNNFVNGYENKVVNNVSDTVSGLTAGTIYYVRIRNVTNEGVGPNSSTAIQITVPLAPGLITFTNVSTRTFSFSWLPSTGSFQYLVTIATDPGFNTKIYDQAVTLTPNFIATGLSASTTYYIKVEGYNNQTSVPVTSAPSTANQRTATIAPNTPTASNVTQTSFILNWNSVLEALSYRLDISTNEAFTNYLSGYQNKTINGTSETVSILSPGVTYYIRVRTVNTHGTSENSSTLAQITIPAAPDEPIFFNITDNSFSLTWDSVLGASAYEIDVSTNNTFTNFVDIYNGLTVTSNSPRNITGLTGLTPYYARIRAKNVAGISPNSPVGIQITLPSSANRPTITNITTTSFRVNWNSVSGADNYRLDVSTNQEFTQFVTGYNNLFINGGSIFQNVSNLSPGTRYYVRIRSESSVGTGPNSLVASQFTVPSAPSQPTFTNIISDGFRVNWNSVAGASNYFIDISTNSGFTSFISGYNNRDVGAATFLTVQNLSLATTYYVRVRASNDQTLVTVTSQNSPTGNQQTSPNGPTFNTITTSSFIVNWAAVTDAVSYILQIATNASFTTFVSGYENLSLTTNSRSVTGLSPGVRYYARVKSINSSSVESSFSSSNSQFTVPSAPDQPTITNVTPNGFRINWNVVTGASSYIIEISTSTSFNNPIVRNATETSFQISTLNSATVYYVRIKAYNDLTSIDVTSAPSTFRSQETAAEVPNTPTFNTITTSSFIVNWAAVTGAASYILQVATNASFTTFVSGYENLSLTTNSRSVTGLSPGVRYYARVKSINSSSVESPFSSSGSQFTTPSAPNQPTFSNILATVLTINWNSVTGASKYFIDISINSGFTSFISGYNNRDVGGSTSITVDNLNSSTTYYVRVRASNDQTLVTVTSQNSPTGNQQTLADLAAPTNLRVTSATQTSFTVAWNSVNTALSYRIDVSTENTFTNSSNFILEDVNVVGTTRGVSNVNPYNPYYIRVRARNNQQTSPNTPFLTQIGIPASPSTPSSSEITSTGAKVSWQVVAGAISYEVDISTNINFNNATTLPSTQRTFVNLTNLNSGTSYYVRVRAVGNVDKSGNSNTLNIVTL